MNLNVWERAKPIVLASRQQRVRQRNQLVVQMQHEVGETHIEIMLTATDQARGELCIQVALTTAFPGTQPYARQHISLQRILTCANRKVAARVVIAYIQPRIAETDRAQDVRQATQHEGQATVLQTAQACSC